MSFQGELNQTTAAEVEQASENPSVEVSLQSSVWIISLVLFCSLGYKQTWSARLDQQCVNLFLSTWRLPCSVTVTPTEGLHLRMTHKKIKQGNGAVAVSQYKRTETNTPKKQLLYQETQILSALKHSWLIHSMVLSTPVVSFFLFFISS